MNIEEVMASMSRDMDGSMDGGMDGGMSAGKLDFYERRPGVYQLIIPMLHEDGDMVDIYLRESTKGEGYVRICDFGMALMRLSCAFEVSAAARKRILDSILADNRVGLDEGSLYLDAPTELLCESVLRFARCVQKVCNMRYWNGETVRSAPRRRRAGTGTGSCTTSGSRTTSGGNE